MLVDLVREWMLEERLSQARAAARLQMPGAWLRRFLRGEIATLRPPTLRRVSQGLGLPEEVVRLVVLRDQAERLADEVVKAVEAAHRYIGPDLPTVAHEAAADAETSAQRLRLLPVLDMPQEVEHEDAVSIVNSMTAEQRRGLRLLLDKS